MKRPYRVFTLTEKSDTKLVKNYVVIEKRRYMPQRSKFLIHFYDGWDSRPYVSRKVSRLREESENIREWLKLAPKPTREV